MNRNASSRGGGSGKTRGWLDNRRKDHHPIHGTPNCSPPASRASSQLRAVTWSGWSARCAGRTTLTSRSFTACRLLSRLKDFDQCPVRSQVKPRPRTSPTTKYRDRWGAVGTGLRELTAQRRLDESAQRVAPSPSRRLRRRQKLVVDRHGGAHNISLQTSSASSVSATVHYVVETTSTLSATPCRNLSTPAARSWRVPKPRDLSSKMAEGTGFEPGRQVHATHPLSRGGLFGTERSLPDVGCHFGPPTPCCVRGAGVNRE